MDLTELEGDSVLLVVWQQEAILHQQDSVAVGAVVYKHLKKHMRKHHLPQVDWRLPGRAS